jgi:RNA polymerase sigma-70 factor (ECF subfamily)
MSSSSALRTSTTLLERLRQTPAAQAAWGEFVRRYGPLVYGWCRRWRLQEADAEDVSQAVLVKLSEKMRTFCYDPARSFRAYLKTLARYAWCDLLESRRRPCAGGDGGGLSLLETVEAGDDLVRRLNEQFDRELLEEAETRVRRRVEPHTWEAFRLTAVEGTSGAEAAARLGLKVATVFKAKSRSGRCCGRRSPGWSSLERGARPAVPSRGKKRGGRRQVSAEKADSSRRRMSGRPRRPAHAGKPFGSPP